MTDKPFAEYAERNGPAILDVLRHEFAGVTRVLEIGSGTGQHAVRFAAALDHLQWQTSDLDDNHPGISAWVHDSQLGNLLPPMSLDVRAASLPDNAYDGVFSANTAHIMSFDSVARMFSIVGGTLANNGVFCLYGPFRQAGQFNTPSNERFHESLRARNSAMGIRDLEALDQFALSNEMARRNLYAMPANNHVAVWQKVAS